MPRARSFFKRGNVVTLDNLVRRVTHETGISFKAVLKRDPCVYCGRRSTTLEHVIPLSKGGVWGSSNRVGACRVCNRGRGSMPLLKWLITMRRIPSLASRIKWES